MKIRLALLETDKNYLNRFVSIFATKFADSFEVYSFSDYEMAMSFIAGNKVDVFLATDRIEVDVAAIPKRCGFSYFVESAEVDFVNEQRAICKFQKIELIYRQILSIYSETTSNISGIKFGDESSKIIIFSSPAGGVGNSTVAAACAMHFAAKGEKTLYLNLERFGGADTFFHGEGQSDMSDVIFALKSKKHNLAMKLEGCVKQAENGVYFFSQPKIALDIMELSSDDVIRLVSELRLSGVYDYIILDIDFSLDGNSLKIYRRANAVVWVSEGLEQSNQKIERAYQALSTLEQNADTQLLNRTVLIYNNFSSKSVKWWMVLA